MRYPNNLSPGLYLSNGVKSIALGDMTAEDVQRLFGGDGRTQTADQLFASVAWIYACWVARAEGIAGLPRRIVDERENEVKEEDLPFDIDLSDLLYRTEISLQARAAAYWLVESNRAGKNVRVRWADPYYIQPEYDYTNTQGLLGFRRSVGFVPFFPVNPETLYSNDLVYVWLPGMAEIGPGVPPSMVQRVPGEIIRNIDRFADLFFDQGGMPIVLISVPAQTDLKEVERVEGRFSQRITGIVNAFKAIAMRADVKVTPLGSPPADLAMVELSQEKRDAILATNRTPISIVLGNSTNRAEGEQQKRNWVEDALTPRAVRNLAPQLNKQLFSRFKLRLVFEPERHQAFKRDVKETTDAFKTLRDGGMTVEAAAFFAGIDLKELPQGTPLVDKKPEPAAPQPNQPQANGAVAEPIEEEQETDDEEQETAAQKAVDLARWERKVIKRLDKTQPAHVPFESAAIGAAEVGAIRFLLLDAVSKEDVQAVFAKAAAGQISPAGIAEPLASMPDVAGELETERPAADFDAAFPDMAGLLNAA